MIQNDYTISFRDRHLQLSGKRLRARETVEVRTRLDGSEHVYFRGDEVVIEREFRRTG